MLQSCASLHLLADGARSIRVKSGWTWPFPRASVGKCPSAWEGPSLPTKSTEALPDVGQLSVLLMRITSSPTSDSIDAHSVLLRIRAVVKDGGNSTGSQTQ